MLHLEGVAIGGGGIDRRRPGNAIWEAKKVEFPRGGIDPDDGRGGGRHGESDKKGRAASRRGGVVSIAGVARARLQPKGILKRRGHRGAEGKADVKERRLGEERDSRLPRHSAPCH